MFFKFVLDKICKFFFKYGNPLSYIEIVFKLTDFNVHTDMIFYRVLK